jgi:nucleotide-binding universal stress UspA family protein
MKNHKISRILVAIDGSEESMRAAAHAVTMARIYDAELLTLTVINTQPWFYSSTPYGLADNQTMEKVHEKDREEAQHWLNQIKANAEDIGIKIINTKILMVPTTSSTSAVIVNYAEQNNVDIIILGTRGRSGLKKILLGSTALGVLTYAHCPVMVVK